jgi:hypothetical protein
MRHTLLHQAVAEGLPELRHRLLLLLLLAQVCLQGSRVPLVIAATAGYAAVVMQRQLLLLLVGCGAWVLPGSLL